MTKDAHAFPPGFVNTQVIGSGLSDASGFDFAPDGRIFILERTGAIKIYKNGQLLPQQFYAFSSVAEGDRGLIGIAFDPDFNTNHYVYFYYTGTDLFNHLVRFDASGDVAPDNGTEIYRTNAPSNQLHVGGSIRFGPDGKMYFAIGDNGYPPNAQDLSVPYGKILRINKDGTIPNDNPFVGQPGALPEIWAYGFRNPWRFQFDSVTGQMYGGDVGNNTWEEVNHIEAGKNYGWPNAEGMCVLQCAGLVDPIYTYNHDGASAAITGGPVYRATQFPAEYQGKYFFADYATSKIQYGTISDSGQLTNVTEFERWAGSVVDLKVAPDGSLYYITYAPARLYKVSYTNGNLAPVINVGADKLKGTGPLTINFSSEGSYDPEMVPLTYNWDFGDGTTSTVPDPTKTYTQNGTYNVTLTIGDGVNNTQSVPMVVQVGLPPTVHIGAPIDGTNYNAGDTISYTAAALDGAGFDMNDASIITKVIFHHGNHIHPFIDSLVGRTNTFVIPDTGEPSADTWYEIAVTATDVNGLSATQSVFLYPNKAPFTLASTVAGIPLDLDGQPSIAPFTTTGVINFKREISAPAFYTVNGINYQFVSWSDGGAAVHTITTQPVATTYTATYQITTTAPPEQTGSFETLNPDGQPVGIQGSHWGNNSTVMSVSTDAHEGLRSGRIDISNYQDGDARWYMDPVDVTAGQIYTYRHWYKSDSTTKIVADVTLTDGQHEYIWLGMHDPSTDWTKVEFALTMPANAAKVTVSQYLMSNGWLIIDGIKLDGVTTPPPPPPPASTNLIANPDIANLAPDTNAPSDWTRGSWGDNTLTYSWIGQGRTDANGLKVEISNYQSGEAKWISKAADVDPTKTYTLSYWYRSTIAHTAVLDITMADGTHQYKWLGDIAAQADWKQGTFTLNDLPAGAQSVRLEVGIKGNGWLNVDDISLTAPTDTVVPPPSPNLIANPDIANLAPDTNAPSDWTRGSWGDNTLTYSWIGQGRTDANGLKVEISNYQSGEAKWISKAVDVDPTKTYALSYWYRSTIAHTAVLDITMADGTHQYKWLGDIAAQADWKQGTFTLNDLPAGATSVRLEVGIKGNGWLNVDDISLITS